MSEFVTRLYQAEGVTPEITAVSDFMNSLLGADCAGEKDLTFMTLRVGNLCENNPLAKFLVPCFFLKLLILFPPGRW